MFRITNLKYLIAETPKVVPTKVKAPKVNMQAVKIDFPLPEKIQGIEKRLNSNCSFVIEEKFRTKQQSPAVIGKNIRLAYLNSHPNDFVDQIITVTGWAR